MWVHTHHTYTPFEKFSCTSKRLKPWRWTRELSRKQSAGGVQTQVPNTWSRNTFPGIPVPVRHSEHGGKAGPARSKQHVGNNPRSGPTPRQKPVPPTSERPGGAGTPTHGRPGPCHGGLPRVETPAAASAGEGKGQQEAPHPGGRGGRRSAFVLHRDRRRPVSCARSEPAGNRSSRVMGAVVEDPATAPTPTPAPGRPAAGPFLPLFGLGKLSCRWKTTFSTKCWMLLCSGPLTNTIQSWVKPSTVGFFLTWARCPSSSFTWTAHCGLGKGRSGECPVSARGSGAGNRPHSRRRRWGERTGWTRTKRYRPPGKSNKIRKAPPPRPRNKKHKNGPAGASERKLPLPPGGRGAGAATGPRCRPAGAGSQGAAVREAPCPSPPPPPATSALGAPGAAAGTWLRRHPPPPPAGCVRAGSLPPPAAAGRQGKPHAKRNSPPRQPLAGGEHPGGTHRAGHAWGAGSAGALAPVPRPHPAALIHEEVEATAGAQRSGGRAAAGILRLAAPAVCLPPPPLTPHRSPAAAPTSALAPAPPAGCAPPRACAPPAGLTPRQTLTVCGAERGGRARGGGGGRRSQPMACGGAAASPPPPGPAPPAP